MSTTRTHPTQATQARRRPAACCSFTPLRPLPARQARARVAALKALADPTRLELVRVLAAQSGPTCACDLVDHFDRSQPTISHHLRILRDAGLVTQTRSGIWSYYQVVASALADLSQGIDSLAAGR